MAMLVITRGYPVYSVYAINPLTSRQLTSDDHLWKDDPAGNPGAIYGGRFSIAGKIIHKLRILLWIIIIADYG